MGKPGLMFTIAKNLHYFQYQKGKEEHSSSRRGLDDKRFSYIADVNDHSPRRVLSLLTQEEREIVMLYAVSGMKHKEIAEGLGLKLSTTLSKYHRALKKLRKYLEGKEARA